MFTNKKNVEDDFNNGISLYKALYARKRNRRRWIKFILTLFAIILIALYAIYRFTIGDKDDFETNLDSSIINSDTTDVRQTLKHLGSNDTSSVYTERLDTVINDIELTIYIPHNATPELTIGFHGIDRERIILAAKAADIRADNGKIVGSFVYKGKSIAKGTAKKGFCAIIEDVIFIGVSDNTSLYDVAIDNNGYFFRQFPLVNQRILVENNIKNKSIRKGLCYRSGEIFIVETAGKESLHDFAQALVDLGVDNAIYLVGGNADGWYINKNGVLKDFVTESNGKHYTNESYIIWIGK